MTKILKKIFTSFVILSFLNSITFAQSISNNALPTNPTISSGSANISQTTNKLTVNQNTDKLITNWSSFNIGKDATVQFVQPSSTSSALNRVTSSDPSYIFGTLQANGKIILVNPNGVLFANGAKVDVGSIIASTLKTADKDFLSDQLIFEKDNLAGTIQNDGTIRAFAGGTVALIGSQVTNNGKIKTKQGTAALLAGDKVTLTLNGNRLIKYNIDEGTLNSLVENNNAIIAKEGVVILSAKALNLLSKSSVNNTGNIEAKGFSQVGGKIYLDGDQTTNSGKLVASSKNNSGGLIQVTGEEVKLTSTASLDASGATGGGTILVGGSFQNSDPTVRQSRKTIIEGGSILNASAKKDGDGGTIVAWSDINNPNSVTSAQGTFLATGGLNSGNGGNIETSGHYLDVEGISTNTNSKLGVSGLWLLDPYNITIGSSGNTGTYSVSSGTYTASANSSTISASTIATALNSNNVTINTTPSPDAGSQSGDITVNSAITKTGSNNSTLTLNAARNITIATNSAISSTNGPLGITLSSAHAGTGGVQINSNLTSNGGDILIGGAQGTAVNGIGYAKNYVSGSSQIDETSAAVQVNSINISSGSGKIVLNGDNTISSYSIKIKNPSGVFIGNSSNITSTSGNIYSTTKSSSDNNFALSIEEVSNAPPTVISSSAGGSIKLDTTNSALSTVALGMTNSGSKANIRFSSLPTVAGLLILVNGTTQPVTFTSESNVACAGSITYCGYLTVAGTNSSYQNAIYGSTTAATRATYVNVGSGTKVYDNSTTASGFTSSSFTADSTVTWPTGFTSSYINSNYVFKTSSKNVGSYSSLTDYMSNGTTTPASFTDSSNNVYAISWNYTNPYTITAKTVGLSASKTYDGNVSLTSGVTITTGISGEALTYTGATANDSHVATSSKYINAITLADGSGGLATNYQLPTLNNANAPVTITTATLTPTISNSSITKVYDGTISSSIIPTYTFAGLVSGDTAATLANTNIAYNSKDVSSANTVMVSGLSISSITGSNSSASTDYVLDSTSKSKAASITNAPLTVTANNQITTYGTVISTGSGSTNFTSSGLKNSETIGSVTLATTQSATTAAGTTGTITPSLATGGTFNIGNYTPTYANGTVTINQAPLTVTANNQITTYGTVISTGSGSTNFTSSGLKNSETIGSVTLATTQSATTAAGTTGTITPSLATGGTFNIGNYTPTYANGTVTINQAPLTVTANNQITTYGTVISTGSGSTNFTSSGLKNSETIGSVTLATTQSATTAAGTTGTITPSLATGGTFNIGNYTPTYANGTVTINQALLGITVTGIYSGSTTLSPSSFTTTGLVNGETIDTLTSATLNSKNVANNNTNYVSTIAINSGTANASNYQITQARNEGSGTTQNTATISPKSLSASISDSSSTYGSSVTSGTLTLDGIIGSDSVSGSAVSIVSPSYSTSNNLKAGTYKQSVTSTLSGTDAGNYTLTGGYTTTNNNYTVNAKPLSVSGLTADNKVYDGTTDATITGTASFSGTVDTDVLSVNSSSVTGTFADKNVGNSKAINLSGVTLTGTDSNNYTVSGVAGVSANITAKSLTTTLTGTASKEYNANTTATLSGSNYNVATGISGETISVTKTVGTYDTKNVGTSKTITANLVSGDYSISGTGALLSNYTLTTGDITGGIGTITAKSLTTTLTGTASKEYDANTTATLSGSNYSVATGVSGETISVTKTTGTYNNKNVGTSKTVTATLASIDYSISGTEALLSNYTLTTGDITGGIGTITAKTVGLSASKTYDGSTSLTDYVTLTTGITGEALTYTGATSNNSHVATASKYISAITLADGTGGLASNYQLPTLNNSNAPVTITAKSLTASAAATNKTYDGTTAATTTLTLSGLIGTETLGQTVASTFSDKNAGTGKTVTVNSIDLADGSNGGLASNYSISTGQTATANITAKALTISGITASDKNYDGTTTATVSTSGVVYSGKVSVDSVTVSATGTFQSASAGRGKTVNLTSTYSGSDVSNYNITDQLTTTANINSVSDTDNSNSSNSKSNSSKVRCELTDCNKDKLSNGEIVIVRKNTFTSDNVKVTPVSIKPEVETRKDQAAPSLIKIIVLKPGQEPKVDKEYEVSIRGNDAILKEQTDIIDKTITNPGKSIGSARFSIENDKGKILEYNMVVRESGLEIRPLSFDALLFADKNKATVAGAAMIDVANNLKLPVDGIKTILFDLIIDKVFEDAMFNQKDSNRNIFNINYY